MAHWVGNVYHGLRVDAFRPGRGEGDYAIFLGRISKEKRPDRAIEIARRAGLKIKIGAKIDKSDRNYYDEIRNMLAEPHVEFLGEVNEAQKQELLANAKVLLFPIDWPEPFGIVMIEAMACGTPVVAFDHGSVNEVIDNGRTGFVVRSIDEAIDATRRIDEISRTECRHVFNERFEATRMAREYVAIYKHLIAANNIVRIPFGKDLPEAKSIKGTLSA